MNESEADQLKDQLVAALNELGVQAEQAHEAYQKYADLDRRATQKADEVKDLKRRIWALES